jgi:hypothetical protein
LKPGGFKLWVNWMQLYSPPPRHERGARLGARRRVAAQVENVKEQTLKPGNHISGVGEKSFQAMSLWVDWIQLVRVHSVSMLYLVAEKLLQ